MRENDVVKEKLRHRANGVTRPLACWWKGNLKNYGRKGKKYLFR